MAVNTITLGGKQVLDPPAGSVIATNCFAMHSGASRVGMGKFLMRRSDYESIKGKDVKELVIECEQGDGITMDVVVGGATPAFPAVDTADDVVEVIVFDLRAKQIRPTLRAYNANRIGFYPAKFYKSTTFGADGTTEWTWTQLVDDLEVSHDNATLPSTWKPRNAVWDNVAKSRIIDDVVARLFLIAGFDGTTISLFDPGTISDYNTDLLDQAEPFLLKGGDTDRNTKSRLPGIIRVTFPGVDPGSEDPYSSSTRIYQKDVSTGVGDPSIIQSLHVGEYQAIRSAGGWANQAELDAVADNMATRCINAMAVDFYEAEYAGIWFFDLDGYVRGIRWISDDKGARTIIRVNNDKDFHALGELQRANETLQNMLVAGIGETRVGMTAGGTRMIWGSESTDVLVKITANAAGGGKYTGTIYAGTSTAVVTGNLALPEGLTVGSDVTILNPEEDGFPTHWIKLDTYVECAYTGGVDGDGNRLVTICSTPIYRTASPETLGDGTEGSDTPDETSWTRGAVTSGAAKGDCAVDVWLVARTVYTPGGDEVLYQMFRKLSFDAGGRLYHISDETQRTIDTPDIDCT